MTKLPYAPILLVADDEATIRTNLKLLLESEGYQVREAADGGQAARLLQDPDVALALLDLRMPVLDGMDVLRGHAERLEETPIIVLTAYGGSKAAIEAMKLGAYDYITKPFDFDEVLFAIRRALTQRALVAQVQALSRDRPDDGDDGDEELVGRTPGMLQVFKTIGRVAPTRESVLIVGESGTGKELVANAIHKNSDRAARPFIKVNSAALSPTLLESELFGHEKGAFTGAVARRIGRFEQADGGTLFLDEIGDLDVDLQAKLLRVLQTGQFERVGGDATLQVDVRMLAATNRDLTARIAEGRFREDLFYRLNVVTIELPPLRQRREDIPLLVEHVLRKLAHKYDWPNLALSPEALTQLTSRPWPGNVRELQNVLARAAILARGRVIGLDDVRTMSSSAGSTEEASGSLLLARHSGRDRAPRHPPGAGTGEVEPHAGGATAGHQPSPTLRQGPPLRVASLRPARDRRLLYVVLARMLLGKLALQLPSRPFGRFRIRTLGASHPGDDLPAPFFFRPRHAVRRDQVVLGVLDQLVGLAKLLLRLAERQTAGEKIVDGGILEFRRMGQRRHALLQCLGTASLVEEPLGQALPGGRPRVRGETPYARARNGQGDGKKEEGGEIFHKRPFRRKEITGEGKEGGTGQGRLDGSVPTSLPAGRNLGASARSDCSPSPLGPQERVMQGMCRTAGSREGGWNVPARKEAPKKNGPAPAGRDRVWFGSAPITYWTSSERERGSSSWHSRYEAISSARSGCWPNSARTQTMICRYNSSSVCGTRYVATNSRSSLPPSIISAAVRNCSAASARVRRSATRSATAAFLISPARAIVPARCCKASQRLISKRMVLATFWPSRIPSEANRRVTATHRTATTTHSSRRDRYFINILVRKVVETPRGHGRRGGRYCRLLTFEESSTPLGSVYSSTRNQVGVERRCKRHAGKVANFSFIHGASWILS